MTATLLVELFTEELPPKALKTLGEAFAAGITEGLRRRNLLEAGSAATAFATPRRLAVTITQVRPQGPDEPRTVKLMPVTVAYDAAGHPTAALVKKLATLGYSDPAAVPAERLSRRPDGKAESLFHSDVARGQTLQGALQGALDDTVEKLPIPKVMQYQRPDGTEVKFVRPAHRLVALHGTEVVPVTALGLAAGRGTFGHRQLSAGEIAIPGADGYAAILEKQGKVVASFAARRERIAQGLAAAAGADRPIAPDALLDEVTALVEWPVVYAGRFDEAYLEVPQECLILTMQQNQKYFALADANGRLLPRFLLVSNLETADPAAIVGGNERVLRARLADAKFFYDQDRKVRLETRLQRLAGVVYHNKLGSQLERVQRIVKLAGAIARRSGADPALAERAAHLAKADLVTDMVGEFPELQGVMGEYYARHDGEPAAVARAIEAHYHPRFAGDSLPADPVGAAVALADRLDTLVGIFGIGLVPTGDKDPFALRRHALGVLRILMEGRLALDLPELVATAHGHFPSGVLASDTSELYAFMMERLRNFLRERGFAVDEVDAVVSQSPARIDLVVPRLEAVQAFRKLPEAEALAAANKRAKNILRKAGVTDVRLAKPGLLAEPAEQALAKAIVDTRSRVDAHYDRGEYVECLRTLAGIKPQVDEFFDKVLVNAEDPAVRENRLALLSGLEYLMNRVADISRLAA